MTGIKVRLISEEDSRSVFKGRAASAVDVVKNALTRYNSGDTMMPDKISQIFDERTQNRINCMPATLISDRMCGVKWVSVFPTNASKGLRNVSGVILLSSTEDGLPLAVIDGTFCTRLRTAAVGTLAARYLAPSRVRTIGIIGSGEEAKMHFALLKNTFPEISECRVASRSEKSENHFIRTFKDITPDVRFTACAGNYGRCTDGADIIVTAISSQEPVLKAEHITKGCLYIHVGGWEDEYAVALKADKIVCDDWESAKHRTQTICRMYKEGILSDADIYANLHELVSGCRTGRENDEEFIYFNSVGLSYIDLEFARHIYNEAGRLGLGTEWEMSDCAETDYSQIIF